MVCYIILCINFYGTVDLDIKYPYMYIFSRSCSVWVYSLSVGSIDDGYVNDDTCIVFSKKVTFTNID